MTVYECKPGLVSRLLTVNVLLPPALTPGHRNCPFPLTSLTLQPSDATTSSWPAIQLSLFDAKSANTESVLSRPPITVIVVVTVDPTAIGAGTASVTSTFAAP